MPTVFRFTTWTRQGKIPAEVASWYEHFKKKGIPAAIVKKIGTDEYAVYREGVEAGGAEPDKIGAKSLEIIQSCHAFKLEINVEDGALAGT